MKVYLGGTLKYGNVDLALDIEIEAKGAVALIGPNLSGKNRGWLNHCFQSSFEIHCIFVQHILYGP
ncbi:hypothetical protein [Pyrobaculum neutrophilum]|uniref:hypothetical protein n=1 Tax=Pyrobaculum neutrophilum TaxID=70771 RepID=UPI000161808B